LPSIPLPLPLLSGTPRRRTNVLVFRGESVPTGRGIGTRGGCGGGGRLGIFSNETGESPSVGGIVSFVAVTIIADVTIIAAAAAAAAAAAVSIVVFAKKARKSSGFVTVLAEMTGGIR